MSLADAFTGTRALPALQTSSEVTKARDLLGGRSLVFEALNAPWVLQQETNASLQCFDISRCRFLLANCNSIRSADK